MKMQIFNCTAVSALCRRKHTPTLSYYYYFSPLVMFEQFVRETSSFGSFILDRRVDKVQTRVSFPALFNVATGIRESLSNQKRQAIYAQNKVEAQSRKCFCRGKAKIMTYSECVSVAFVIQHAKRKRRILLSSVVWLVLAYFSKLSHKQHDFGQTLLNIKCVVLSCIQVLSEIFIILKRNLARYYQKCTQVFV